MYAGSFALNKLGFGLPNAPNVPIIVEQKYAQSPDPRAPHGPFFILEQTTQQHGLAGTAIDIEIAGYPGKKVFDTAGWTAARAFTWPGPTEPVITTLRVS